ncbi:g-D-glutamyl-meso-diaminopimelate peptidase [Scopulibacillus darangshiensis]|uniref:G-D-glutamyl-meso-diaminopimelate peptidase n=1 Tax=Scopulibacillus darangshiensis TaxID=442528 RepID=A0A4R2PA66_9BACL|nr:M14 family metallopeptidase [Scopulibacillus darangshiensis]TCP31144.1 g-D-glutamyl-meso-diaminopimelate peptidase [Scopulibacillus darangshiensis]
MNVTVRKGDTLWYYSQLFDVPLQLVIDSNEMENQESLEPGRKVAIPGYVRQTYTLDKGESFWSVATKRQLALDTLFLLNPDLNPKELKIGETIYLPVSVGKAFVKRDQPYDSEAMARDINRLTTVYPFVKRETVGKSVEGKPIYELRIGNGEKKVHYNGSFHANEWITSSVIMTFLNDYLVSLTNRRTMRGLSTAPFYDQVALSIVPMVNPDGVDLVLNGPPEDQTHREKVLKLNKGNGGFKDWKANIRGVDLNDQFPAKWELEQKARAQAPAPRDYPGESPLCEPEAKAIADLTKKRDFDRVLAFHTQGRVIYWGFEEHEPEETETMAQEFSRVSGYEPIRNVKSYAGYKDWFEQDFRRPGFTVELGSGTNPLPLSQFDEIYQESLGIFLASLYL